MRYFGLRITWLVFPLLLVGCVTNLHVTNGDKYMAAGDCRGAVGSYEKGLQDEISTTDRTKSLSNIEKCKLSITNKVIAQVNSNLANNSRSIQSLTNSILLIEDSVQFDDNNERLQKKRNTLAAELDKKKKIRALLIENINYQNNKEYHLALETLKEAYSIDNTRQDVVDEINKLNVFIPKHKRYLISQINTIIASREQIKKSLAYFEDLKKLPINESYLNQLKLSIDEAYKSEIKRTIQDNIKSNQYITAFNMLSKENIDEFDTLLFEVQRAGSTYYLRKSKDYSSNGNYHRSYIAIVKAMILESNDNAIFSQHRDIADRVNDSIKKYIAIPTFKSPANNPDAGATFSDALIDGLLPKLPHGINLLERQRIDLLMAENDYDIYNVAGKLRVNMIITGNVTLLTVDKNITNSESTILVKVGETEVPNPTYDRYFREYGSDINTWPVRVPMFLKQEKSELIKYKRGHGTIKAFGKVTVRIFDTEKAAIVYSKTFDDTITKKDEFNDSVPLNNITEDPLELPTETELTTELYDTLCSKIRDVVTDIFADREKRFLNWGLNHIQRREYDKALEFLAQGHLYSKNAQRENDTSKEIHRLMISLTENE